MGVRGDTPMCGVCVLCYVCGVWCDVCALWYVCMVCVCMCGS